jgi:hypothetical protein
MKEQSNHQLIDWSQVTVALSVRQPWAWLIIRPDMVGDDVRASALARGLIKDIENRDWATSFRGPVLIHAGKKYGKQEKEDTRRVLESTGIAVPDESELRFGGIIGGAVISGCAINSNSRWFVGRYGFVLEQQTALPFRAVAGKLGFFNVRGEQSFTVKEVAA